MVATNPTVYSGVPSLTGRIMKRVLLVLVFVLVVAGFSAAGSSGRDRCSPETKKVDVNLGRSRENEGRRAAPRRTG